MAHTRFEFALATFFLWLTVAALAAEPKPAYESVLIKNVPHVAQKSDFCGEACVAMWLQRLGRPLTQDDVFNAAGLDPVEGRGCYTRELARAATNLGFQPGAVWYGISKPEGDSPVSVGRKPGQSPAVARQVEAQWKALHADLIAGIPSIICMHYSTALGASEHFRLVLGYDAATDTVIYHEPAEAGGAYRRMDRAALLAAWPLAGGAGQATVIRIRLAGGDASHRAGTSPATAAASHTPADFAQHMLKLKPKIPKGFTVVIVPPFVVIGDESPERVRERASGTVKWAADKLKAAYFTKDPADILDVWLFNGEESYLKHCKSIFHNTPDTPYGYFSHTERALIMNIATGGGTLVHEIVHPFVAANFPECPSWFNEGLGSLYEQCGEENGRIHGYTNWRLRGLQEAIQKKRVPSFKSLCGTTETEFYEKDKGTNYAQARYLCYYLQQQGLLGKFYHRFHADCKTDPTGYNTLKAVLGRDDMDAFQKEWEAWVMKLRFVR